MNKTSLTEIWWYYSWKLLHEKWYCIVREALLTILNVLLLVLQPTSIYKDRLEYKSKSSCFFLQATTKCLSYTDDVELWAIFWQVLSILNIHVSYNNCINLRLFHLLMPSYLLPANTSLQEGRPRETGNSFLQVLFRNANVYSMGTTVQLHMSFMYKIMHAFFSEQRRLAQGEKPWLQKNSENKVECRSPGALFQHAGRREGWCFPPDGNPFFSCIRLYYHSPPWKAADLFDLNSDFIENYFQIVTVTISALINIFLLFVCFYISNLNMFS